MKIIFHEDYHRVYASDPAASEGRMEAIDDLWHMLELEGDIDE